MKHHAAIELLESRIAPATVLPGGRSITYTDLDGDVVTVTVSKGTLTANNLSFDTAFGDSGPQQLQALVLNEPQFAGASVSVVAKAVNGLGNGLVNVGFIQAINVDLASVKVNGDLGRIVTGDSDPAVPGLKSLSVQSLGLFGTSTQANGGTLRSFITGGLAQLTIAGDMRHAEVNVINAGGQNDAGFGKISIGGSLIGGATTFSGQLYAAGNIGLVKIGGDLVGGATASSGQISAGGSIAGITIGGSLVGGSYDSPNAANSAGTIISGTNAMFDGSIGFIKIGKSIVGGEGNQSGQIIAGTAMNGGLKSLFIGGDVLGGPGSSSGQVTVRGKAGSVQIGGHVIGGEQLFSGRITIDEANSFAVKGSVIGGAGDITGTVSLKAKTLSIGGSLVGGAGATSGSITATGTTKIFVGGSLAGDSGLSSGSLNAGLTAGSVKIQGSIINGATLLAGKVQSVAIGGDLAPGPQPGSLFGQVIGTSIGTLVIQGSVKTGTPMTSAAAVLLNTAGSITIGGSVVGSATSPAIISIQGIAGTLESLGNFTVKGRFEHARLFVGNGTTDGFQIGNVAIGGDFIASAIAVGTKKGGDNLYGTGDDIFIAEGANPLSRVASLVIKGQAFGTPGGTDSFGILAESFGKVTIRGVKLPLTNSIIPLGPTGDLTLELAP